jgi:GntR family transcriptional regulator, transcriptional repressor for pyruvate dehydrogenase complex
MGSAKLPAHGNLSARVARYLVEYIRKHRLPHGAKIPSEVRLSAELKVSRGIIREAFRSLETAGILHVSNGRAPSVGSLNNRAFTQFLQHALATEQASEEQVFDVRSSIELRAAELAADKRTQQDVDDLRHEASAMRAAAEGQRRERFVKADVRFHEIIARATGNPLFGLLGGALRESLDLTIRAGFDSRRSRAELERVAEIHNAIADAIAKGDAAAARQWMSIHFDEARRYVLLRPMQRIRAARRLSPGEPATVVRPERRSQAKIEVH